MAATAESLHSGLAIVREGADFSAAAAARNELFRFRFGTAASARSGDGDAEGVFRLYIDSIGESAPDEIWTTNGAVVTGKVGDFAIAECEEYLAAHLELDPGSAAGWADLGLNRCCHRQGQDQGQDHRHRHHRHRRQNIQRRPGC